MSFAKPVTGLMSPLMVLGLSAAALLFDPLGAASNLRGKLFDTYQRHAISGSDSKVELVTLDSGSLARFGRWPWANNGLSQLTRAIAASGAQTLVFATPLDRPESDAVPAPLSGVPTIVPVLLGVGGLDPRPRARFDYSGQKNPFGVTPGFSSAAGPIEAVAKASAGLGAPNLIADPDGVVRQMPTVFRFGSQLVPSLAMEAARMAAREKTITVTSDEKDMFALHWGVAGMAGVSAFGRFIPTASDGRFWIDHARTPEQIPAGALLSQEMAAGQLKGKILVLDTPEDILVTALGPQTRGAVMAQGIENLVSGRVLTRPSFAVPAEFWSLIVLGGITMLLMARFRGLWAGLFAAAAIAVGFYGSWFAFIRGHMLLDAATPSISLALIFTAGAVMRAAEISAARAGLRMAFSDSLPHASVEKIAHSPQLLSVEGENRTVTYLVCGVRGLSELASSLTDNPKAFTQTMQKVMTPLMDQALAHGGTIDRLTADGFAAFWNAPLDDGEHALHACEAAASMSVMASRVSEEVALARGGPQTLEIGVGIATGPVIAGGFGGAGRMGYSVTGGVVQLAGRIQALSPQYGPAVIVAEETQAQAQRGFAFLEVDYIAAGHEDAPVRLYALLGSPVVRASPKFRALIAFHEHIFASLQRQQWAKARALIDQCRKLSGASQKLYDLHLTRIGYFESNPPGPEWDGAFRPILK
jgi:adenylate cyclase